MNPNNKHLDISTKIDAQVRKLERDGCNELEIFVEMSELMPGFKMLLDTLDQDGIDQLCARYDGFYRYAKILENIAEGIASGEIKVPR